jgi:hypothetical protein
MSQIYKSLKESYKGDTTEDFFLSYAVRGGMVNPWLGTRSEMHAFGPMRNSSVFEPSPLNSKFVYDYARYGPRGALKYVETQPQEDNKKDNKQNNKYTNRIYPPYYVPDNNYYVNPSINPWFNYYQARGPTIGVYNDN